MTHTAVSAEADAAAADAVRKHHAVLAAELADRVAVLGTAASKQDSVASQAGREALVSWCRTELLPHAAAEEHGMYRAAHADLRARLLIDGMLAEHQVIGGLVDQVAEASDDVEAAGAAKALQVLFESHLAKENDLVLPLLTASPTVSLAEILHGMHELLGEDAHGEHAHSEHAHGENAHGQVLALAESAGNCDGTCTCGEKDSAAMPELDARTVPHAIRHATIFGALDSVGQGSGMVLVAPHDPVRLLDQLEAKSPGVFSVEYLERGPEAWRLAFTRN